MEVQLFSYTQYASSVENMHMWERKTRPSDRSGGRVGEFIVLS